VRSRGPRGPTIRRSAFGVAAGRLLALGIMPAKRRSSLTQRCVPSHGGSCGAPDGATAATRPWRICLTPVGCPRILAPVGVPAIHAALGCWARLAPPPAPSSVLFDGRLTPSRGSVLQDDPRDVLSSRTQRCQTHGHRLCLGLRPKKRDELTVARRPPFWSVARLAFLDKGVIECRDPASQITACSRHAGAAGRLRLLATRSKASAWAPCSPWS
jgi:hypothetical protein